MHAAAHSTVVEFGTRSQRRHAAALRESQRQGMRYVKTGTLEDVAEKNL